MSANERFWLAIIAVLLSVGRSSLAILILLLTYSSSVAGNLALSDGDQANLARIETYLNDIGSMQSSFIQVNPDGTHSEGTMYLWRPGRLRFEYDPPDNYLIIAHGKWFTYVDKDLDQATYLPVDKTPAYFILKKNINFGNKLRVVSFQNANKVFRVEVEQVDEPDSGRIIMIFTDAPLQLRKWQVIDSNGNLTDTTLNNPNFDVPLNEELFEYDGPAPNSGD